MKQIGSLPEIFFGSFVDLESLRMELRGRAILEPWSIPPVHSSLEMEASLLDSGVLELLATEDLGAYGLTANTMLQWATLTEFPCVLGYSNSTAGPFRSQRARRRSVRNFLQTLAE